MRLITQLFLKTSLICLLSCSHKIIHYQVNKNFKISQIQRGVFEIKNQQKDSNNIALFISNDDQAILIHAFEDSELFETILKSTLQSIDKTTLEKLNQINEVFVIELAMNFKPKYRQLFKNAKIEVLSSIMNREKLLANKQLHHLPTKVLDQSSYTLDIFEDEIIVEFGSSIPIRLTDRGLNFVRDKADKIIISSKESPE